MRRDVGTYLYEERLLKYLPLSLNMLENWRQKKRRGKKKKEFMRVIQVPEKEQLSIKWTTSVKYIFVILGHFHKYFWLKPLEASGCNDKW